MPSSLPSNPSLDNLKKRAKALLDAVRAGDARALALVAELHPRPDAVAAFKLADAQLVVARGYGFPSWAKLKQHLAVVDVHLWDPPSARPDEPPEDELVRLACMDYESWHPEMAERARRLLAERPELARANLYTAATVGDAAAVADAIARDPALVNRRGGPLGWEPLLHACYARLDSPDPGHSTLAVARALLAAGADPNAGFLWRGNVPPFTALTGAFGEGENGNNQPPHRDRDALARMLLDAGADPNDGQTLYNRHFNRADDHLELLFEYGLGRDRQGPWYARLGARLMSPAAMLVEELWAAARKGFVERVKLLVEHGTDVNARGVRDGRTPHEAAALAGHREIVAYLEAHGARRIALELRDAFAAACVAGQRDEVRALLERDPTLLSQLDGHAWIVLVHRAVEGNRPDGIRLMAELGFPLDTTTRHDGVAANLAATPMHDAAWGGALDLVKLLVELGARTDVRDASFDSTPLGWADHNQQQHVVDYLMQFASIFDAVHREALERVAELLREDPRHAVAVDARGVPLACHLHPDGKRLDELLGLLRPHGFDLDARDRDGKTAIDRAVASGRDDFAAALRARGAG
jgi:ankyrin repeat protein